MDQNYHLQNIRTLLREGFTAEELRRLCYDHSDFRPVYHELSSGMGKTDIVDRLIEHANIEGDGLRSVSQNSQIR